MKDNAANIKFILWIGTAVPSVLIILISIIILNQFNLSEEATQWVEHTHEVISATHEIQKLTVDMETGQRGFIITGKEHFLTPFYNASTTIFNKVSALKNKVNDNQVQVARLEKVEIKIQEWLTKAGKPEVEARKKYDLGQIPYQRVSDLLIAETGKKIIDSLRQMFADFISTEKDLVLQRQKSSQDSFTLTKVLLFAGVCLVILVAIVTGVFTSRTVLEQDWIKTKQAVILTGLQDIDDLNNLSDGFLERLLPAISTPLASFYMSHLTREKELYRVGTYGVTTTPDNVPMIIKKGDGLVGQCLVSGETIQVTDIPADYFKIHSSLGSRQPNQLTIFPIKSETTVIAVIELASFSPLCRKEMILLNSLLDPLGVIVSKALAHRRTEELLAKTQTQADHLKNQKSEIEKKNKDILKEQQSVKTANATKSKFLANMSHELRTPMHTILGFSDLGIMNAKEWNTDETIKNLNEIKDGGTRLLTLLNDLLDLSKLESNVVTFDFAKHDLKAILLDVVKSFKTLIDDKKLQLNLSKAVIPTYIECDYYKIFQVLTNFFSNAIKFTPKGKMITAHFENTTLYVGKRELDIEQVPAISFSVIDQGIGIPEGEHQTVFDKFVQSSKTKTGGSGTGLGLAISKEIIDGHMGKIWAENTKENTKENGTTFTFTIPLKQAFGAK